MAKAWGVRGSVKFDTYKHLREGASRFRGVHAGFERSRKPKQPRTPTCRHRVSQMETGTAPWTLFPSQFLLPPIAQ